MNKFTRLALIAIVALGATIALAGCANDFSLFDRTVGTWQYDGVGKTVLVLNNDSTALVTYTVGDIFGTVDNGTWTSNSTSITIAWDVNTTQTYAYTFANSYQEMTLTGGTFSKTYTRQ